MNKIEFDFLKQGNVSEAKKHPTFPGVLLSAVNYDSIKGLRLLYVEVEAGKAMLPHVHEDETEIHFVISGTGKATVESIEIDYSEGIINKIPKGSLHSVLAGSEGLQMIAVFMKD